MELTEGVDMRYECAKKCAEEPSCVAFNYGNENGYKFCHSKFFGQKSSRLGKTCGTEKHGWMYYTLLKRDATCKYRGTFI